jgi:hypothetical protein
MLNNLGCTAYICKDQILSKISIIFVYFNFNKRFLTFRVNLATPLVEGIVVSRRALGSLVRQTTVNMGKRRRLDHDRYGY